jgi:hypothetical protein
MISLRLFLSIFDNKKSLFPQKGNRLFLEKVISGQSRVSSATRPSFMLHEGPAGFVPPGCPEFTFSETSERSIVKEHLAAKILYKGCTDFVKSKQEVIRTGY